MVLVGLPAAAGLALVAQPLATLMVGPALRHDAARVTPWIALSGLFYGFTSQYLNTAFTLGRRTVRQLFAIGIPALANLGLTLLLIPRYGLDRAMWATTASYALGAVVSIALQAARCTPADPLDGAGGAAGSRLGRWRLPSCACRRAAGSLNWRPRRRSARWSTRGGPAPRRRPRPQPRRAPVGEGEAASDARQPGMTGTPSHPNNHEPFPWRGEGQGWGWPRRRQKVGDTAAVGQTPAAAHPPPSLPFPPPGGRFSRDNPHHARAAPRLSVLTPFYRDNPHRLLAALDREARRSAAGSNWLLLLDDAGGDPALSAAVAAAADALSFPVRLIQLSTNAGRAKGRNRLVEHSRGRHLLFLDSDMLPDRPDFLAGYLSLIETDDPAVAVGGFSVSQAERRPEHALHRALALRAECIPATERAKAPAKYVWTSNLLVRRDVFEVERFDEAFTGWGWEDTEWGVRVAARFGVRHLDNPATHLGLDTASALAFKYEQSPANFARMAARHPEVVASFPSHRMARVLKRTPGAQPLASRAETACARAEGAPARRPRGRHEAVPARRSMRRSSDGALSRRPLAGGQAPPPRRAPDPPPPGAWAS